MNSGLIVNCPTGNRYPTPKRIANFTLPSLGISAPGPTAKARPRHGWR
jgi:hypothetical protein